MIWAAGWYVGLDPVASAEAFAKRAFWIYDVVVAAICFFAVPVALALDMSWGRRLPRWLVGACAWFGTCILLFRSVASIAQGGYLMITGEFAIGAMGTWEWWFYLGTALWLIASWRYWRGSRATGVTRAPM